MTTLEQVDRLDDRAEEMSYDVAGTGFTVLDRVYVDGAEPPSEELGGSCGNVLISLAMLNHRVAPILTLGTDDVGDRLVCELVEAGASTTFVQRSPGLRSPVLAQLLRRSEAIHSFSFTCPETDAPLPRYRPLRRREVNLAMAALRGCSVFYTDRLTGPTLDAMKAARAGGALIYLEPSRLGDRALLERALEVVDVLKFSSDRMGEVSNAFEDVPSLTVIVTHGADGLEVRRGRERVWCDAIAAETLTDTCGAGDMVSVGVIDWVVRRGFDPRGGTLDGLIPGIVAGQRLASANCAHVGARGLFRDQGSQRARAILDRR